MRSGEATLPGLVHDECSGFHPFATESVFAQRFDLESEGLRWAWPEVQYAHPLDGGRGGHVVRSVAETAASLGPDHRAYSRMYDGMTRHFDTTSLEFLQPLAHVPRHPFGLARMGRTAALSASAVARRFDTDEARGLWAGVAAHAFRPLDSAFSAAAGLALGTAAHRFGWPVAVGGSGAVAAAMIRMLEGYGGRVETGVHVTSADDLAIDLAGGDLLLLDTSPPAAAEILGDRLSERTRRGYDRWTFGVAAFQVRARRRGRAAVGLRAGTALGRGPRRRDLRGDHGRRGAGQRRSDARATLRAARAAVPRRPVTLCGRRAPRRRLRARAARLRG